MGFSFPQVAGEKCSFANIEIKIAIGAGQVFRTGDFAAIDWEDGVEFADVPGCGSMPCGYSVGLYSKSASLSMYRAKFYDLQSALALAPSSVNGICLVPFDILVQWTPLDPSAGGRVFTSKIAGAHIMGRTSSNAPGPAASVVAVPLFPSFIEDDRKRLIKR